VGGKKDGRGERK
jgi:hypothetical protein